MAGLQLFSIMADLLLHRLHPLPLDSRRTYTHADSDEFWSTPPSSAASSRARSSTRVLKIRHVVQEARDEPYLS